MTREDEIAARLAAATPGPWHHEFMGVFAPDGPVAEIEDSLANARFIAHAPDDIRHLLARVRELKKPVGTICRCGLALASPEAVEQMAAALDTAKALRPHGWASNHLLAAAILAALREQP